MSKPSYGDLDKQEIFNSPIKVMVVDNKNESLAHVGEFLASYSFRATCVNEVGVALTMLTDEKADFDIILLDSGLRGVDMITFLRLIKDMDILKMEDEVDDAILFQAFDNGAFLVITRKLTKDFVINARQHVIRKRIQKFRKYGESFENETKEVESAKPSYRLMEVNEESKKVRKCYRNGNSDVGLLENKRVDVKRSALAQEKTCVKWTKELHSKFLSVAQELGEGNCFPTTILDAMGVPGLTRMQVASHLQKCRRGWHVVRKRGRPSSSRIQKTSSNYSQDIGKFGYRPLVETHVEHLEDSITSTNHAALMKRKGKLDVSLKKNLFSSESTLMNEFGLENIEPLYSLPSTHQHGLVHHNLPHNDLFDFMNVMEGDETFYGNQLHSIELNKNYIRGKKFQDDAQEMLDEVP